MEIKLHKKYIYEGNVGIYYGRECIVVDLFGCNDLKIDNAMVAIHFPYEPKQLIWSVYVKHLKEFRGYNKKYKKDYEKRCKLNREIEKEMNIKDKRIIEKRRW